MHRGCLDYTANICFELLLTLTASKQVREILKFQDRAWWYSVVCLVQTALCTEQATRLDADPQSPTSSPGESSLVSALLRV